MTYNTDLFQTALLFTLDKDPLSKLLQIVRNNHECLGFYNKTKN